MGKQHNRRIFAGFYKRYDNKYIYVVAVVPDVDTGSQVVTEIPMYYLPCTPDESAVLALEQALKAQV